LVDVPGVVSSMPAAHAPKATQLAWFGDDEYVPAAHGAHSPSLVLVGGTFTHVPGGHVFHGVQLAAFAVALKLPLAHAAHVRPVGELLAT
jgi:hypothetical protein